MDVRDKYMLRAYSYFLYTQPRAVHRRENTEQDTDITGVACSHLNKWTVILRSGLRNAQRANYTSENRGGPQTGG